MATLMRVILICLLATCLYAEDQTLAQQDSLPVDSTQVIQNVDSTSVAATSMRSAWILPLAVITVTGGFFVLLFTSRSK